MSKIFDVHITAQGEEVVSMSALPFEYLPCYKILGLPSTQEVLQSIARGEAIRIELELFGGEERVFFSVQLATCPYRWAGENEFHFEGWGTCDGQTCLAQGVLKFSSDDKGTLYF